MWDGAVVPLRDTAMAEAVRGQLALCLQRVCKDAHLEWTE
jgi:hypothetical protein